jgi:hypothetical protein
LVNVADNEVLPTLLNPVRRKIEQVSADAAYDTKDCLSCLNEKAVIPITIKDFPIWPNPYGTMFLPYFDTQ